MWTDPLYKALVNVGEFVGKSVEGGEEER